MSDLVSGSMIIYWNGQVSCSVSGNTPFGFYDSDISFQNDAPKAAIWASRRLGYPIMDIELKDTSFYACFEEACNEYSAQVNSYRIRENMLYLQGSPTSSNFSNREIRPNMGRAIRLSEQFGTEVGVGGNVSIYSASLDCKQGVQTYDLVNLNFEKTGSGKEDIEIVRIFHAPAPAMARFFDPFVGSGVGTQQMLDSFGFGGMSPAVQFQMMPIYSDILRMQAIEFNDQIRKSGYGFELVNNNFRILPTPREDVKVWFRYLLKSERGDSTGKENVVTDYSNAKFDFIQYKNINDVGRQWIFKYFLALCKELLGIIRSKYQSIEIPGSTVSMDGDTLRSEAAVEKENLITQLRETLDEVSLSKQLAARKEQTDNLQGTMQKVPLPIYIGILTAFCINFGNILW